MRKLKGCIQKLAKIKKTRGRWFARAFVRLVEPGTGFLLCLGGAGPGVVGRGSDPRGAQKRSRRSLVAHLAGVRHPHEQLGSKLAAIFASFTGVLLVDIGRGRGLVRCLGFLALGLGVDAGHDAVGAGEQVVHFVGFEHEGVIVAIIIVAVELSGRDVGVGWDDHQLTSRDGPLFVLFWSVLIWDFFRGQHYHGRDVTFFTVEVGAQESVHHGFLMGAW